MILDNMEGCSELVMVGRVEVNWVKKTINFSKGFWTNEPAPFSLCSCVENHVKGDVRKKEEE